MNKELLKNDFYEAVNENWLKKAKIPGDASSTGLFRELHKANEKKLKAIAKELTQNYLAGKEQDKILNNFAKLYLLAKDYDKRAELGVEPILKHLKTVESIKSLKDYVARYEELYLKTLPSFIEFSVFQDFVNAEFQTIYVSSAGTILPEVSYYDENHPNKKALLAIYKKMMNQLLKKVGYSRQEAKNLIDKTFAFDELLAKYYPTGQEAANYLALYNPYDAKDLVNKSKYFDFVKIAESLTGKKVEQICFMYPRFLDNIDTILNEDNFENFKAWMIVETTRRFAKYLDNDSRLIADQYSKAQAGVKKSFLKEKAAFRVANEPFSIPVGTYFAKKYFGESAKKDVESKVYKMIDVYAKRIKNSEWLSAKTKEKALVKLRNLGVHIGYPTEFKPYYEQFNIRTYKQGSNLLDNVIRIQEIMLSYNLQQYKEPVNKNYWSMSPDQVNAYYSPFMNHIVFPAGILSGNFYSQKQSSSQNYGGIGAVIAHEISHAFDNHGAHFDEKGNKNMWWSEEDFAKFEELGQKMVELFDGVETEFGKCNGKLTLSENIADGGGISCALEASMSEKGHSSKEFFENWAVIWRSKYTENYAQILLKTDPHAPTKLRANQQVKNLDEFYKTFDIKEGDKMFLPKEKRVKIW